MTVDHFIDHPIIIEQAVVVCTTTNNHFHLGDNAFLTANKREYNGTEGNAQSSTWDMWISQKLLLH